MRKLLVIRSMLTVASVLMLLSCNNDEKKPDCGCDGMTTLTIDKAKAAYIGNGFFAIQQKNEANQDYLLSVRTYGEIDGDWVTAKDSGSYNYTVSGDVKKGCLPEGLQPNVPALIQFQLKEIAEN